MLAAGAPVGIAIRDERIGVSPRWRCECNGRCGGDRCDGWNAHARLCHLSSFRRCEWRKCLFHGVIASR
ncbi:hypothetical protein DDK01_17945 [Mycobacteroides abscessus]|nr:hypothetical protein DDK01_17945 [Mycobacteroides abscessus]